MASMASTIREIEAQPNGLSRLSVQHDCGSYSFGGGSWIATFNRKHFDQVPELEVIEPVSIGVDLAQVSTLSSPCALWAWLLETNLLTSLRFAVPLKMRVN
jgi:hypothetical protein